MIELESLTELDEHLAGGGSLEGAVLQGLDLRGRSLRGLSVQGAVLLGCKLDPAVVQETVAAGALVFPEIGGLPYKPYRGALYTVEELYECFDRHRPESYQACLDARVYQHWQQTGRAAPAHLLETLARRLHDHAITDALDELLAEGGGRRVVAIMGGHSMQRSPGAYLDVARIAHALSRDGFLIATGGGPGAMEAGHLGAWFAERSHDELDEAVNVLAQAPAYDHPEWLARAFEVRERYPLSPEGRQRHPSLGIPTWLYGHEPPNAFASHVAKYFANSVREDGLLAIAKHGVIFSPGSAGTIQEIFQDACQNHYATVGVVSPMVFLGRAYWTEQKPVYPLLEQLAQGREYARWLSITDTVDEAVAAIRSYAAAQG